MSAEEWTREVLDFWFGQEPEQWWRSSADFDDEIRARFLETWEEQQQRPIADFLGSAEDAIAAIILFDQFPRNMFRGDAQSYATDHMALAIAAGAMERGYDELLDKDRRAFLYMPFQHSEDLGDQQRSVLLFTKLGDAAMLRYARLHHEVIERFGRFPHRNKILGRSPRADELAAGDVFPW